MPKPGEPVLADKQAAARTGASTEQAQAGVPGRTTNAAARPSDGDDSPSGGRYQKPSLFGPPAALSPAGSYSPYAAYQAPQQPAAIAPAQNEREVVGQPAVAEPQQPAVVNNAAPAQNGRGVYYALADQQADPAAAQPQQPAVAGNYAAGNYAAGNYQPPVAEPQQPAVVNNTAPAQDGRGVYYAVADQQAMQAVADPAPAHPAPAHPPAHPVAAHPAAAHPAHPAAARPAHPSAGRPPEEHRAPVQVDPQTGVTTRPLGGFYANEEQDASKFRGSGASWQNDINADAGPGRAGPQISTVSTRYMNEREQDANTLSMGAGNKLLGANGENYDTSGALGVGTQLRAGAGKHIFSLTPDGQVRAADPWAQKQVSPKQDGSAHLGFVNHSSLVAGGDVAAAGELTVREGQLQQISDSSGHYQPNGVMMGQALDHFESGGLDVDNVDMRFGPKTNDPSSPLSKPMFSSTQEFRNQPDANEAEMRMRTRRLELGRGIAGAAQARDERVGDKKLDQIRRQDHLRRENAGPKKPGNKP